MLVGVAKAKAEGKYKGRAPTARMKAEKVRQLKAAGVGPSEIARQVGISRTSVFRILTGRITDTLLQTNRPPLGAFSFGGLNAEEVPFMRCSVHLERVRQTAELLPKLRQNG